MASIKAKVDIIDGVAYMEMPRRWAVELRHSLADARDETWEIEALRELLDEEIYRSEREVERHEARC